MKTKKRDHHFLRNESNECTEIYLDAKLSGGCWQEKLKTSGAQLATGLGSSPSLVKGSLIWVHKVFKTYISHNYTALANVIQVSLHHKSLSQSLDESKYVLSFVKNW